MTNLWPTVALSLVLIASCHARAASSDDFMKMLETKDDMDSAHSRASSGYRLGQSPGDFSLPLDSHSEPSSLSSSSASSSLPSSSLIGESHQGFWEYPQQMAVFGSTSDDDTSGQESNFRKALEEDHLLRLKEEILKLRNRLLAANDYQDGDMEKRFKPSGFMGSRGKRFIPGLESLLLAKYYQDAEKWKRQPHLGFHGSRG